MPLYEYKCQACGRVSEVQQKFNDPPLEKCEVCAGSLTKLVSLGSFSLKGKGWYTTDYKRAVAPTVGSDTLEPTSETKTSPAVEGATSTSVEPAKKVEALAPAAASPPAPPASKP